MLTSASNAMKTSMPSSKAEISDDSAFISKNDIFPPPELASPSDDDEIDLVRLEKVRAMMSGIDRRTRSKALPGSMEDDDDE